YGDIFINLIQHYCQKHGIEGKQPTPAQKKSTKSGKAESSRRYFAVGEAFNAGESIQDLAEHFDVTTGTIIDNLAKYVAEGYPLPNLEYLETQVDISLLLKNAVFNIFEELGSEYLKPVFDKLNGSVSYSDLKILRLIILSNQSE
ncbi:MAG: helix-turn-helix domain-containing protein, partial [Chloroflexota bacterium]